MKTYLVTLTPQEPYFFGNEKTFLFDKEKNQGQRGKSYYIRFKSALKKLDSQFFMDFFEYAPSNIFNGATPEDIW